MATSLKRKRNSCEQRGNDITLDSDGSRVYWKHKFLDQGTADALLQSLLQARAWCRGYVHVRGQWFKEARSSFAVGDSSLRYAGKTMASRPWTDFPAISDLRNMLVSTLGQQFNVALVNLYEDGTQKLGWHSDDVGVANGSIASISLGATRRFGIRKKRTTESVRTNLDVALHHGTLLVMSGPMQQYWQHCLHPDNACNTPRINITFRNVAHSTRRHQGSPLILRRHGGLDRKLGTAADEGTDIAQELDDSQADRSHDLARTKPSRELPIYHPLPLGVETISAPLIWVPFPLSRLLIWGLKYLEIRENAIPEPILQHDGKAWLVEAPGKVSVEDVRLVPFLSELPTQVEGSEIIGMVRFGSASRYASWTEFDRDLFAHCLHPSSHNDPWLTRRRHGKPPFKWHVLDRRELDGVLPCPCRREVNDRTVITRTANFIRPRVSRSRADLHLHWLTYDINQ